MGLFKRSSVQRLLTAFVAWQIGLLETGVTEHVGATSPGHIGKPRSRFSVSASRFTYILCTEVTAGLTCLPFNNYAIV